MNASEMNRVIAQAACVCDEVISNPEDASAREALFEALGPVIDLSFTSGEGNSPLLAGLSRQAATMASLVRDRIDEARAGRVSGRFVQMHIGAGTRELRRVLSQILRHLSSGDG